jgi:hypothetical protein
MSELHLHDPQTLYRHWEESQWSPWEIDLSVDRAQWEAIEDHSLLAFVLGSLMVAEERITTKFSGLVGAGASEEEVTFLATQQIDEARHMQFYARFQDRSSPSPRQSPRTLSAPARRPRPRSGRSSTTSSSPPTSACSPTPATLPRRSVSWRSITWCSRRRSA